MLKNEMESYVRMVGRGLKNHVGLHGGRRVKNCQNHAYVINDGSLVGRANTLYNLNLDLFKGFLT